MHPLQIAALVVAIVAAVGLVVVLGYGGYELAWKAKRLRGDLMQLQQLNAGMTDLQAGLVAAQERIAAASAGIR